LLSIVLPLGSLKILDSPDTNVWVEEGGNVSMHCTSDHPWQWCYWERDNSLNDKTIYQTVQEHTSLDTYNPSIKFSDLGKTSCGINILGASVEEHQVYSFL
jgi:hypothetical protein